MTVSHFANVVDRIGFGLINVLVVVDRIGFGLINVLVVVGLPLAAIGVFIQPL